MTSQDLLKLAVDWIPFVVFLGLLLFFARKMRPQQNANREYMDRHIAELRHTNALLERIAASLESKNA